ncbi:MAG: universal stress protein [Natrialbaceae archaeon]|nr:universal stress protein [Natrialbaceae archaeon]
MFETLVLATDGSESVRRALAVGLDLADRFDARVHAISVIDEGDIEGAPEGLRDNFEHGLKEMAEEALAALEADAGRPIEITIRTGHPAPTICEYADEVDASAIVMGTRGRHGEHRALLGSVAERVLRTASVPVLTVRQE